MKANIKNRHKLRNALTRKPIKYTFIFSLFIIVAVMFVTAGPYFHLYQILAEETQQHLETEKTLLSIIPKDQPISDYSNDVAWSEDISALPTSLAQRLANTPLPLTVKQLKRFGFNNVKENGHMMTTWTKRHNTPILIAVPIEKNRFSQILLLALITLSITVMLFMAIYGYLLSSHILRRIGKIDQTAQAIMKGKLNSRIPIHKNNYDEYTLLSKTLNAMLDKIDALVNDLKQTNNNVAHDLKTPLNRLRARLEMALISPPDEKEFQDTLVGCIEHVDELHKTFNALLLMGNLDSSTKDYQLEPTRLDTIIHEICDLYHVVAEENQQIFTTDIDANITINANKKLISQAIVNLIDNAIKYTPTQGKIHVALKQNNKISTIVISDNGIGIPKHQYEAVFKRFTRLDEARSEAGTGLGLSLVRSILAAHNASIQLSDNNPGLRIEIRVSTA